MVGVGTAEADTLGTPGPPTAASMTEAWATGLSQRRVKAGLMMVEPGIAQPRVAMSVVEENMFSELWG